MPPVQLGVTDIALWLPNKRDILFFDRLAVGHLDRGLSELLDPAVRADWEFLVRSNIVSEFRYHLDGRCGTLAVGADSTIPVDLDEPDSGAVEYRAGIAALALMHAMTRPGSLPNEAYLLLLTPRLNVGPNVDRFRVVEQAAHLLRQAHEQSGGNLTYDSVLTLTGPLLSRATIRSTAGLLNSSSEYSATPIIPYPSHESAFLGASKVTDVVSLVLSKLPTPDELTPWEAILDFRNDGDTREQLARLRRWSRKASQRLASESAHIVELEDELDYLIESYRAHMQLHRLKISTSVIEVVVTFVAEVAENLLKARLKELAKGLFQVRQNRIALTEAELKAPGREIAYVVSASEHFRAT